MDLKMKNMELTPEMVLRKLKTIETKATEQYVLSGSKLRATKRIHGWLTKLNSGKKKIVGDNYRKMQATVMSLKGEGLTATEKLVLRELINNENFSHEL